MKKLVNILASRTQPMIAWGGILLIGGGLWMVYPPLAMIVVGALAFADASGIIGRTGP